MLSLFITKDCSKDHILYKYSHIIITLVISFNCIFNNFSIDKHMGFGGYNIAFQRMKDETILIHYEEAQVKFFSKYS